MTKRISKETALRWKQEYEAGDSIYDIEARECAKNNPVSNPLVARMIRAVGGTIRTYAETAAMKRARQEAEFLND